MTSRTVLLALAASAVVALWPVAGRPAAPVVASADTATQWKALEQGRWIADGRASAKRIVYMFTDPNCPYCNKLWTDARPWVDAGKVQLRHVMVGILTPTSNGKAAALLNATDPPAALAAYEKGQSFSTSMMIASGKVHALNAASLAPLSPVPAPIQAALDGNTKLMHSFGIRATPAVVWLDANGALQTLEGVAPADEARVFGPR